MNIFLIGFMGSGKSSLGKKLAKRLDKSFIDLDDIIQEKEGQSILKIFTEKGEDYFRKLEQAELYELGSSKNAVIALGGGASCNALSWAFLEQNGLIIYIKEKEAVLLGRLREAKANRPLIATLDDEELKKFIHSTLRDRKTYYEKAHFTYEKEKTSWSFLVKQIEDYIR